MQNQSQIYYAPIQLKMPVEMERMIEVDDPVYSFNEVLRHIDLNPYFVEEKDHKTGRPRYDAEKLLLETALISCGFNLHKFHLKSQATLLAA